jgi:hypothetical protein
MVVVCPKDWSGAHGRVCPQRGEHPRFLIPRAHEGQELLVLTNAQLQSSSTGCARCALSCSAAANTLRLGNQTAVCALLEVSSALHTSTNLPDVTAHMYCQAVHMCCQARHMYCQAVHMYFQAGNHESVPAAVPAALHALQRLQSTGRVAS